MEMRGDLRQGKQRLYFRGKGKKSVGEKIIQRSTSQVITGTEKLFVSVVPDNKYKIPDQICRAILTPFFIGRCNEAAVWKGCCPGRIQVQSFKEVGPVVDSGITAQHRITRRINQRQLFIFGLRGNPGQKLTDGNLTALPGALPIWSASGKRLHHAVYPSR